MAETEAGLSSEQQKLFALARAARARIQAPCGAAVVDETGRTYSGADVTLPSLVLTSIEQAVAAAAAAGAGQLHGCVVVTNGASPPLDVFADLAGAGAEVVVCRPDQAVVDRRVFP